MSLLFWSHLISVFTVKRDERWNEKEQAESAEEGGRDTEGRLNILDMLSLVVLSQVRLWGSVDLLPAVTRQGNK